MLLLNELQKNMAKLTIEIAYANEQQQSILSYTMQAPCTARQALIASGILNQFPEIDLTKNTIGIFSKKITLEKLLQDGDRLEIYRPLSIDPKQARRLRAKKISSKTSR